MPEKALKEMSVLYLPIEDIRPSPYQQRKYFDFDSLNRLTDSIRKYGVLQPVTVRAVGRCYELISGERRLRAARAAGLKTIPAAVVKAGEEESSIMAFSENLQRKNLSCVEEAEGYRALMDDFGMTEGEAAAKTGVSLSVIESRLKILELPEEARRLIAESGIDEACAEAVMKIPDKSLRMAALREIISSGMSAAQAEDYVNKLMFPMCFSRGRVKAAVGDMRLFTNSIKRTVETARKAGIAASCDVEQCGNCLEIQIKVSGVEPTRLEVNCSKRS